jgi:hypothetical protein
MCSGIKNASYNVYGRTEQDGEPSANQQEFGSPAMFRSRCTKQENVQYFNYLDTLTFNDASCTREIKSRIAMAKTAFNKKKKALFTSKLDLNLRKKLVKCYIWSIALYGAETWTLGKVDQKYLKSLKCGAGEEWRRSAGPIV